MRLHAKSGLQTGGGIAERTEIAAQTGGEDQISRLGKAEENWTLRFLFLPFSEDPGHETPANPPF
ncbi:hypothetical protein Q31b_30210 [Novipirellula aureliae]|uniref:Uncharacterized protein n=2 Tax=Novipirellula aureliae TaxID=2527966 RepID=A0A5C6DY11_9BACT|nr:hypothetical protein Q31b_30210 [Novipirellula aureliae]